MLLLLVLLLTLRLTTNKYSSEIGEEGKYHRVWYDSLNWLLWFPSVIVIFCYSDYRYYQTHGYYDHCTKTCEYFYVHQDMLL